MTEIGIKLRKKSFEFALRIVKLARFLETDKKDWVLSRQILKSGTSIGANVREGQEGQSRADFVSKLGIALKESNETLYWLDLLHDTEYIDTDQYGSLIADCIELKRMLTSIIKTARENGL